MNLPERLKVVPLGITANYNSGYTADSINMKNYHSALFILTFGANSGNAVMTEISMGIKH